MTRLRRLSFVDAAGVAAVIAGLAGPLVPSGPPQTATLAIVAAGLLANGGNARLLGWSVVAVLAGGIVGGIGRAADGLGALVVVSSISLTWLIAAFVPAAIAIDRELRDVPFAAIVSRIPYLASVARGYTALILALAAIWLGVVDGPIEGGVRMAFLAAVIATVVSAVGEDRRRASRRRLEVSIVDGEHLRRLRR